jgi:hypothetical protein
MPTLDRSDPAAEREHAVYEQLAADHRSVAAQLRALGDAMAAQRDLPMGRHDESALSSPAVIEALGRFVTAERELRAVLERGLARDEAMLRQARG